MVLLARVTCAINYNKRGRTIMYTCMQLKMADRLQQLLALLLVTGIVQLVWCQGMQGEHRPSASLPTRRNCVESDSVDIFMVALL